MPGDLRPIRVRGAEFYPLAAFPGYNARINYTTLTVELTFSPDAFTGTRLTLERELQRPKPSPVLPSVFVNYDLNYQRSASRGNVTATDVGALLELGASSELGGVSNAIQLHRSTSNSSAPSAASSPTTTRFRTGSRSTT